MQKNVLFRGCTRPPMFLGVPYVTLFLGAGGCFLFALYVNLFWLLLLPVVVLVMRQMARRDEMIFRLLGLRLQVRLRVRNARAYRGRWVFTANVHRGQARFDE